MISHSVGTPPQESIIRAMAIHTAPEMIGDNLTCCPNHEDENQKKGIGKIYYGGGGGRTENAHTPVLTPHIAPTHNVEYTKCVTIMQCTI